MVEIDMPVAMKIGRVQLNFKEAYIAVIWSKEETDKDIGQEMEKLNQILQLDGFQIVKWEKRSDFEQRIRQAFRND